MHLPKHDGEQILQRLRSTERYAQTPVVLMTGWDFNFMEKAAIKHAALSYFRKPSSTDEFMQLGNIVRGILDTQKISSDLEANRGARGER
jgi:DNA-binding response OmpR family regulator